MTTIEDLVRAVEDAPENTIVRSMLVDELIEARDMQRSEADRYVAAIALAAHTARQIRQATELLAEGTVSRGFLHKCAQAACYIGPRPGYTLLVVEGDEIHLAPVQPGAQAAELWGAWVVLAGAGWLLRSWEERRAAPARRRPARRRSKKK